MNKFLFKEALGLFILRLSVGLIFMVHGWSKFQNLGRTAGFFDSLGVPEFMAYVVAAIELVGGVAIILGILTRHIAILFAVIMIFAIVLVKAKGGFSAVELELALLGGSIALAFIGGGKWQVWGECKWGRENLQSQNSIN